MKIRASFITAVITNCQLCLLLLVYFILQQVQLIPWQLFLHPIVTAIYNRFHRIFLKPCI